MKYTREQQLEARQANQFTTNQFPRSNFDKFLLDEVPMMRAFSWSVALEFFPPFERVYENMPLVPYFSEFSPEDQLVLYELYLFLHEPLKEPVMEQDKSAALGVFTQGSQH